MATTTSKLKIEGMHCDACAQRIRRVLERQPGVSAANVSFPNREATVTYDEGLVGPDKLRNAIEKAGYGVESQGSSP